MRSPYGARLKAMLVERGGRWFGLAAMSSVHDAQALQQSAREGHGGEVRVLDLKASSEALVANYRERILAALGAALALLAAAVAVAFRDARRAWHVIAPMSLATLAVAAVLHLSGVSLSLFHLVALTLAAGLGLHYALFFERPVADAAEARRTLHATLVCVAAAVLVFGLLGTSVLPVLRAIGVTVALGVAFHFCLSIQMAQRAGVPAEREWAGLIPHQGAMSLLDTVVAWDDTHLHATAISHRDPYNPLRSDGILRAVHLCEYAAQATAVHGALAARQAGMRSAPGLLVALREVELHIARIDDLAGALDVHVTKLLDDAAGVQYAFHVDHGGVRLAAGRVAILHTANADAADQAGR
jgi:predicted hotdog family 3-hydroxylacyl-ACP dehydratase